MMIYYGMLLVTCGFVEASPACSLDSRMTRSTSMGKVTLDASAICLNPSASGSQLEGHQGGRGVPLLRLPETGQRGRRPVHFQLVSAVASPCSAGKSAELASMLS